MEQLTETWQQYVDVVLRAGVPVSPEQAIQLGKLAAELAELHEREAAEYRRRVELWQGFESLADQTINDR